MDVAVLRSSSSARLAVGLAAAACALAVPVAQEGAAYKSAVVALSDDPQLRVAFEEGLVAKAISRQYDAVTSYVIAPDVGNVKNRRFLGALSQIGARTVLMLRPAAAGPGSSLDAIRNEVSPEQLADMRKFAGEVSPAGGDDLVAVVHMAIYTIENGEPVLISSGAVWLDEPVASQEEGIERLQDLIVANVDAVRPAIRQRLGLPPLAPRPN